MIINILLIFIGIVFLVIAFSAAYHSMQLAREKDSFVPMGEMVEVDHQKMHVYQEGGGQETLVFMSGNGTSSPVFDFTSLFTLLKDQYKIAVVEKQGYGFSEITDSPRDVHTIMSQTRKALADSGVRAPYILVPHSASGLEALYWAHKHPDEVKAIIGLDIAVPAAYENLKINIPLFRFASFLAKMGITRWIPNASESSAMKEGTLTEREKEINRAVFYRRTATKNMLNEVKEIHCNAEKVGNLPIPDVPILLFASNGEGTGWDKETWSRTQRDFIQKARQGRMIELNTPHSVHNIEYHKIATETKEFLNHEAAG
ncbi:alpha/beta fold hydrolase [Halobacillus trueperi]|uniref:alpha/beta hydrolase n=1 Tax=Halobacillus trueperi TaxID=156205 RepID=UPI0037353118